MELNVDLHEYEVFKSKFEPKYVDMSELLQSNKKQGKLHKNEQEENEQEEEEEVETRSIVKKFGSFLKSIKSSGDFSDHGTLDSFVSLGLEIDGIGMIGFPLSEIQAQQLEKEFEKDRNNNVGVFQLEKSKFKLNEYFQKKTIHQIKGKLMSGLGLGKSQVNLELQNLVLFQKNSFLKKQKEGNGKMIGKLIVSLPSIYEGGEIVIYHEKKKRSIDFSKQSKHELGWIAFYSDCEHKILPLKSGCRLVLVYNICLMDNQSSTSIPKSMDSSSISKFGKIFEQWQKNPSMIGIRLNHEYPVHPVRIYQLENEDLTMFNALRTLSKRFPIEFFLVTIKIKIASFGGQIRSEVDNNWIDSKDEMNIFGKRYIGQEFLFPENPWKDLHPYDEEEDTSFDPMEFYDSDDDFYGKGKFDSTKYYRFGFILVMPSSYFGEIFDCSSFCQDAIIQARQLCPSFNKNDEKWKKVIWFTEKIQKASPEVAVSILDVLNEVDSIDYPIRRKNTKKFIRIIHKTNSRWISKLELFISKFGGWSQWKETMFVFSGNLERPWALLDWMLNDCSCVRPTFIKTNEEREEIQSHAKELVQSRPIRPPMCLVISKLGDISLAKKMLPKLLLTSWDDSVIQKDCTFPHICSLLQGFGFHQELCEIVEKFLEQKADTEIDNTIFAIWSMFFRQTSLRRLRMESTKVIVRFGRLIGTNKKLSDRNRAILKLVLNEFASSRLSAKETNELITGSFNRSTLNDMNLLFKKQQEINQKQEEQADDAKTNHRDEKQMELLKIPLIARNTFVSGYLNPLKSKKRSCYSTSSWDAPITCLKGDFKSDGPPALGGKEKQKFVKSLFELIEIRIRQIGLHIGNERTSQGKSVLNMLLSLSCFTNNWILFSELMKQNDFSKAANRTGYHKKFFFAELERIVVVAEGVFGEKLNSIGFEAKDKKKKK